jgi:hypothetical protein
MMVDTRNKSYANKGKEIIPKPLFPRVRPPNGKTLKSLRVPKVKRFLPLPLLLNTTFSSGYLQSKKIQIYSTWLLSLNNISI